MPSGQIQICLKRNQEKMLDANHRAKAIVKITREILDNGGFEDVMTLALAPFLRRQGFFMVHAFTAAIGQQAVMFAGPSGQGKTSAGLVLVCNGWSFLANDVTLLSTNGSVKALLSPGTVHTWPSTLTLLPHLTRLLEQQQPHPYHGKIPIPRLALLARNSPQLSAEMTAVYFPEITRHGEHTIIPLNRAEGLARLMESSIDQWDRSAWQGHIDFLVRLSHQVTFRQLMLGQNLSTLPELLDQDLYR